MAACSNVVRGEIAGRPRLAVDNRSNVQLLESGRDINPKLPIAQRATSRKQQMETARADIAYVTRLDASVVREWGRLPRNRTSSGGIRKGTPNDEP